MSPIQHVNVYMYATSACLGMRRPNIWPEKHLPQLRLVFQALGQLMAIVGESVAALCDLYMLQKVSLHQQAARPAILDSKA